DDRLVFADEEPRIDGDDDFVAIGELRDPLHALVAAPRFAHELRRLRRSRFRVNGRWIRPAIVLVIDTFEPARRARDRPARQRAIFLRLSRRRHGWRDFRQRASMLPRARRYKEAGV